jgi:hypothetical protein
MSYSSEFQPTNGWNVKAVNTALITDLAANHLLTFMGTGSAPYGDLEKDDRSGGPITDWATACHYTGTNNVEVTKGGTYTVRRYPTPTPVRIYCFPPGAEIPDEPPDWPLVAGGAVWVAEEG